MSYHEHPAESMIVVGILLMLASIWTNSVHLYMLGSLLGFGGLLFATGYWMERSLNVESD